MFLTVHAPIGALIGMVTGEPVSAFALGVLSHAVFDIIPHGDEHLGPGCNGAACTHADETRFLARIASIDGLCMLAVLAALLHPWTGMPSLPVLAGIAGGVLPDVVNGFAMLFPKIRVLARYGALHHYVHCGIIRYESSFPAGLCTQLVTLAIVAALITRVV
jgi:hypothetical protein